MESNQIRPNSASPNHMPTTFPDCPSVTVTDPDVNQGAALLERLHAQFGLEHGMVRVILPRDIRQRIQQHLPPDNLRLNFIWQKLPVRPNRAPFTKNDKSVTLREFRQIVRRYHRTIGFVDDSSDAGSSDDSSSSSSSAAVHSQRASNNPNPQFMPIAIDELESTFWATLINGSTPASFSTSPPSSTSTLPVNNRRTEISSPYGVDIEGPSSWFHEHWSTLHFAHSSTSLLTTMGTSNTGVSSASGTGAAPTDSRSGVDAEKSESSLTGTHSADPHHRLPGISEPMFYLGSRLSRFCWHTEDAFLYSVSINRSGAPKVWYAIPWAHARAFEQFVERDYGVTLEALLQKNVSIDPRVVMERAGIPVTRGVQYPGDMVVTFPLAYHAGFNCGFNIAEAVNVAPMDWLPFGHLASMRDQTLERMGPLDVDRLTLRKSSLENCVSPLNAVAVDRCLEFLGTRERKLLDTEVVRSARRIYRLNDLCAEPLPGPLPGPIVCRQCRKRLFVSFFVAWRGPPQSKEYLYSNWYTLFICSDCIVSKRCSVGIEQLIFFVAVPISEIENMRQSIQKSFLLQGGS